MSEEAKRLEFLLRISFYAAVALAACLAALYAVSARAQQIPLEAARWKHELTRQGRLEWGLEAPIATFAAQVQQESSFNPAARSPVGAVGLAQFMPATATWIAEAYEALALADPLNPIWALRALATYDRYLWERALLLEPSDCERAAFMLSAYNGGEGAREREVELCLRAASCNPDRWFDNVEDMRWRAPQFWRENRGYVRRILRTLEPAYVRAGWGAGLCQRGDK